METFSREIGEAVKNFDRYVICLQKTPEDFAAASQLDKTAAPHEDCAAEPQLVSPGAAEA